MSLVDFLGPDNQNIRQLAAAFPGSKIISRGNEIKIQGQTEVISRINDIFSSLIEHYHQYGQITDKTLTSTFPLLPKRPKAACWPPRPT